MAFNNTCFGRVVNYVIHLFKQFFLIPNDPVKIFVLPYWLSDCMGGKTLYAVYDFR